MESNIFVHKNFTQEDFFSNSICYLMNLMPEKVGNRFIKRLAEISGLSVGSLGNFKEAIFTGHHLQSKESISKPDMIIETSFTKIFFEIKLTASLSNRQLQRHFKDVERVKGKLVFLSNSLTIIPEEILERYDYLKPVDRPHYLWADFTSLFDFKTRKNSIEERLIQDFKKGLRNNGIINRQIVATGSNLYTNGSRAETYVLDKLKEILKEIGFSAWKLQREFTIRVNVVKRGVDPLLNPKFYASGEFLHPECLSECMIVHCYPQMAPQEEVEKLFSLVNLSDKFKGVRLFESEGSGELKIHIYVPLKFIKKGKEFDLDWYYLTELFQFIYSKLK